MKIILMLTLIFLLQNVYADTIIAKYSCRAISSDIPTNAEVAIEYNEHSGSHAVVILSNEDGVVKEKIIFSKVRSDTFTPVGGDKVQGFMTLLGNRKYPLASIESERYVTSPQLFLGSGKSNGVNTPYALRYSCLPLINLL